MRSALALRLFDTAAGEPAAGVRFQLYWCEPAGDVLLRAGSTDADGSTASPALEAARFSAGTYKLVLHVGDYLVRHAAHVERPCFDLLHVVFQIADARRDARVRIDFSPQQYVVFCE